MRHCNTPREKKSGMTENMTLRLRDWVNLLPGLMSVAAEMADMYEAEWCDDDKEANVFIHMYRRWFAERRVNLRRLTSTQLADLRKTVHAGELKDTDTGYIIPVYQMPPYEVIVVCPWYESEIRKRVDKALGDAND